MRVLLFLVILVGGGFWWHRHGASASQAGRSALVGTWRLSRGSTPTDEQLRFFADGTVLRTGSIAGPEGLAGRYAIVGSTVTIALGAPGARGGGGTTYELSADHTTLAASSKSGAVLTFRRTD